MTDTTDVQPDARRALLDAAKALLPERAPSTITGRELADAAGVNYGLVHHYFGSKDSALREALLELRDEFLASEHAATFSELLSGDQPFLRATGLSQVDYPTPLGELDDFPAVDEVVAGVRHRMRPSAGRNAEVEAKARAMAMVCLQLGRNVYADLLHAMVHTTDADEHEAIDAALARIYRTIALADGEGEDTTR